MKEFIEAEAKKLFLKAIRSHARVKKVEETEVSILFWAKTPDDLGCGLVFGNEVEEVTFKVLAGIKHIDFKGYGIIVPPYLLKRIIEGCNQYETFKVELGVYINPGEDDEVDMFLFADGKVRSKLSVKDFLTEEQKIVSEM
jgi:hypothetical protein